RLDLLETCRSRSMAPQTRREGYTQRLAAVDSGNYYIIVIDPQIQTLRVVFRGNPLRTGGNKRCVSLLSDGTLSSLNPLARQMPILSEPGVWTEIIETISLAFQKNPHKACPFDFGPRHHKNNRADGKKTTCA